MIAVNSMIAFYYKNIFFYSKQHALKRNKAIEFYAKYSGSHYLEFSYSNYDMYVLSDIIYQVWFNLLFFRSMNIP